MTALNMASHIRHLYTQGLRDYEICERIKTSPIFTKHIISRLCMGNPYAESSLIRLMNLLIKAVYLINNDPYFEEVNRFD